MLIELPISGDFVDPTTITQVNLLQDEPKVIVWMGDKTLVIGCADYDEARDVRASIARTANEKALTQALMRAADFAPKSS